MPLQGGYRNDIPAISYKEERQKPGVVKKDASYWRGANTDGCPKKGAPDPRSEIDIHKRRHAVEKAFLVLFAAFSISAIFYQSTARSYG